MTKTRKLVQPNAFVNDVFYWHLGERGWSLKDIEGAVGAVLSQMPENTNDEATARITKFHERYMDENGGDVLPPIVAKVEARFQAKAKK